MNRTFTCEYCKKEFPMAWTEQEALKEKEINFPGMPLEEMALTCDECYEKIMQWARETGLHNE